MKIYHNNSVNMYRQRLKGVQDAMAQIEKDLDAKRQDFAHLTDDEFSIQKAQVLADMRPKVESKFMMDGDKAIARRDTNGAFGSPKWDKLKFIEAETVKPEEPKDEQPQNNV